MATLHKSRGPVTSQHREIGINLAILVQVIVKFGIFSVNSGEFGYFHTHSSGNRKSSLKMCRHFHAIIQVVYKYECSVLFRERAEQSTFKHLEYKFMKK